MASRAIMTVKIYDSLDKLQNAVVNCDPQTPAIAVDTVRIIETEYSIDEVMTDKFLSKLNDLTSAFSNNCRCESVQTPYKIGQSRRQDYEKIL